MIRMLRVPQAVLPISSFHRRLASKKKMPTQYRTQTEHKGWGASHRRRLNEHIDRGGNSPANLDGGLTCGARTQPLISRHTLRSLQPAFAVKLVASSASQPFGVNYGSGLLLFYLLFIVRTSVSSIPDTPEATMICLLSLHPFWDSSLSQSLGSY